MYIWLLENSPCKQDVLMLLSCIKPPHCNVSENHQSNSSLVGGDSKQAERLGISAIAFSSKETKTDCSFRDLAKCDSTIDNILPLIDNILP